MANIEASYRYIDQRRKLFYLCTCPPRPVGNKDRDLLEWYMNHVNTCKPRPVEDVHLPEYEGI
jgi:hypothetical protein